MKNDNDNELNLEQKKGNGRCGKDRKKMKERKSERERKEGRKAKRKIDRENEGEKGSKDD